MAIPVEMPKLSDTMEEGVVSEWLADEGEEVSAGDVIAQVETDKATMDLEVFDDGVLLKRVAEEGASVPLGELIAVLGDEGEDISDLLSEHGAGGDGAAAEAEPPADEKAPADEEPSKEEAPEDEDVETRHAASEEEAAEEEETAEEDVETQRAASQQEAEAKSPTARGDGAAREVQPAEARSGEQRVKASPLARRLASEHDIDVAGIEGSGPEGRVVKRDVEARIEEGPAREPVPAGDGQPAFQRPGEDAAPQAADELYEAEPVSQMRKAIARRLVQSKFSAPHFYLTVDIDTAQASSLREQLNALAEKQERPRISFNDLITKACAVALRQHPQVNASYLEDEEEIRHYRQVHVGVAVAVEEGLLTPVIRNADQRGLADIAQQTREMAERARNRKLQPEEYEGSTFTTSNLGMYGIEEFTAIINPPNACILAIGAIREEPVVEEGKVTVGERMRVTLSCDHRVVDGATGAEFLSTVKELLEEPMGLLL